jgi:hypothetical protein
VKHRVAHVSVLTTSRTLSFWYFLLGLCYIPVGLLADLASPSERLTFFWLVAPFIWAVVGFLAGALACALYNFAASKTGGIEVSLRPSAEATTAGADTNPTAL